MFVNIPEKQTTDPVCACPIYLFRSSQVSLPCLLCVYVCICLCHAFEIDLFFSSGNCVYFVHIYPTREIKDFYVIVFYFPFLSNF